SIQGNYANNILRGNVNNNEFRTGGGNDTAYGGLGDDTYYIDSGVLNVQENAGEGIDTLFQVDASWATGGSPYASDQFYRIFLPANVENLIMGKSSSEWINGLQETIGRGGFGNGLDNLIKGDSGRSNELDGAGGRDTLIGGSRVDVFRVDREDDVVID